VTFTLHATVVLALKERGGTWALYQNQALDSAGKGQIVCLRYGPGCTLLEAPDRMPDTPKYGPGWKYGLVARVESSRLPDVADSDSDVAILPEHAPAGTS
jgi:hypothetical protein